MGNYDHFHLELTIINNSETNILILKKICSYLVYIIIYRGVHRLDIFYYIHSKVDTLFFMN